MDTPGYGMSDRPLQKDPSIESYAQSVVAFLRALNISQTSIVGHHTGAAIAVEVAASHPELVDKLILYGCPYLEPQERQASLNSARLRHTEIKEDGSHIMKIWQSPRPPHKSAETRQLRLVNHLMAGTGAEAGHEAVFQYEIEQRLPLIQSPVLLMYGDMDRFYPRLEATKKLIRRCETKVIKGGASLIAFEMPDEFAQAILEFLEKSVISG